MKEKNFQQTREEMEIAKIRIPRQPEVLGIVEMMVGGDKMKVRCDDGNVRICRIPGKLRKRVWIRSGDWVLIEPWKTQSEERGDVVFRYTATQVNLLKRKNYIQKISI